MGRVHVQAHGPVSPERFVAAHTGFGPAHEEIQGNSYRGHAVGHDGGAPEADGTAGAATGGVGQRLRHDWSAPDEPW